MERVHSFWGVVFLARVSWETPQHVTVFWQQFFNCAEDPAAQTIRSLRSKQEISERTQGKLMVRVRIHIVSWCVWKPRKGCVYVHSSCEVVSFRTGKKHTCIHTEKAYTYTQADIQALLSLHLCASGGAVWGYWSLLRLSLNTECRVVVFRASLVCTPNYTLTDTYTPTAWSQASTIHNFRNQPGHKELHTWCAACCCVYRFRFVSGEKWQTRNGVDLFLPCFIFISVHLYRIRVRCNHLLELF